MAVRDHVNRVARMRSLITMVDTANSFVECVAKDGKLRRISVRDQIGPLWRWPQVDEEWMIAEQNGSWFLGERFNIAVIDPIIDSSHVDPGDYQMELAPDQQLVLLDRPGLINTKRLRHTMARKYAEVIGDGTTTIFFVNHMLGTKAVTWSIVENLPLVADFVSSSVVTGITNDYLKLEFAVAPLLNEFLVTVIG